MRVRKSAIKVYCNMRCPNCTVAKVLLRLGCFDRKWAFTSNDLKTWNKKRKAVRP